MDAVEFLKTFREICTKYDANSCLGCPFESGETYCKYDRDSEEEVIRKVEEWRKENPEIKFDLTEQQKTAVRGRITEGYLWVARDDEMPEVCFYKNEPYIESEEGYYFFTTKDSKFSCAECELYNFVTFKNSPINLVELLREVE